MVNRVCENCKYWAKPRVHSLFMDGTSIVYGSCYFLVNGVKVRGARKPDDTCGDFEEGKHETNLE